jgi:hypothetical protein
MKKLQGRDHGESFSQVFDGRKNRIRGLWQRKGRYDA